MKRLMILVVVLALAPLASAQLYKHVDKSGRTVYSDQPPAGANAKQLNIPRGVTDVPSGAKSYVAQDQENQKKRKEAEAKAAKAGDPAKKAQEAEQRCAQARSAHQYFVDGGRIFKNDEKGERVFMSDAEIDSERERTRREMEAACQGR
jgi:molecular chaperone GrpE (heat shock protein)